jgi:hypothetical protein
MPITVLRDPDEMDKVAASVENVLNRAAGDRVGFVLIAFSGQDATFCSNVERLAALKRLYAVIYAMHTDEAPPKLNS